MADRPLDFAFRLGRVRFADTCPDPNRDHEIGKTRIPPWFVLFHLQQDALHAIGERDGCLKPPKYSNASIKQRMSVGVSQRETSVTKRIRE
jgi:hypothetical protein